MGGAGAGVSAEAPPGDQGQHEVLGARALGQRQKIARGRGAALIGHGVSGLDELHATGLGQVAVLHHDEPAGHALAPRVLDRRGHGPGCLARADDHDATRRRSHGGESAQHEGTNRGGGERRVEDRPCGRSAPHGASVAAPDAYRPPAMAGTMETSSPGLSAVLSPSRKRMSSWFT